MGVAYKTTDYGETTISIQKYIKRLKTDEKELKRFHKFLDDVKESLESTYYPGRYQFNIIIEHDSFSDPTGSGCYDDWFLNLKLYKINTSQHDWVIHHTIRGINMLCEYEDKTGFHIEDFGAEFGSMPPWDIPKLIVLNHQEALTFIKGLPVGVTCPLDIVSS